MDKFMDFLQNKLIPPLAKIGNLRYLLAVRNGLVVTLPAIIAGSIFLIIGNIPIQAWLHFIKPYENMINVAVNASFGIISLLAAMGIGYELSKSYSMDAISGGALAVMAFIILQFNNKFVLDTSGFASSGLFTAIISAIISTEIYRFFVKRNIVIRLPEGVPPAVSNSFISLIPAITVLFVFWLVRVPIGFDVSAFIEHIFSPLLFALNSLPGILIYTLLVSMLWCAGVHGDMTLEGVADPIFIQFLTANALAYTHGDPLPYITASGFSSLFVNVGGTGATLTLVLLMLRSRSKTYKELGKVAFPGACFEINEPVIFGFPIVMNPLLMIPFIVVPLILATLSYIFMSVGIIGKPVTMVPWTMPPIIGPLMATGWDWKAGVWSAIEIIIALLMYYPFFKIAEKQMLATEKSTENMADSVKQSV
ncbi:MAG: PTS sugar transporter subunit IIC [Weizmannia coagulans]|jgi:PTS system cellobiose-specific IIC component|uniref:PTS sugar transporter subunit IIC n=1 Tax=Heyndrickxia coagulans TaxID=1398 RepID=UPI0005557F42|nr:PTS sugar transporter subunit IIC [Heyndrickxia coagulans]KGT37677.1 PTS lactose transporter subunit IIC [Heyndrickxia coagulans P38]MCI1575301.1 PTS sugar transporter subunit IIC [Heyndrickxia coagulans]